ncbi:hypothetical protein J2X85_003696 [Microbacterium trichothecenolyticum]|uniref:hypothetical protein n=1 Tax=Microbacterium trichothecenolyticum TaxID=69370 RepID=UPI002854C3EA|nr:hypothetical protein [Microbacterium trichothecenolyticum]MDR7186639.1 hypothetical protein [Microbacterium trichothecenolyticum]
MSQPDAPQNPPAQPAGWAPPGAAPFGTPTSEAPAPGHPGAAAATPQGWASPPAGAYAPPPGYAPPVGYPVPPAAASVSAYGAPATAKRSALGLVALALALVATIGASLFAAIASFQIGLGAGREISSRPFTGDFDWSVLTPVRDWVLMGEVSFWVGTAIGVWALAQGIIAVVKGRGRGAGIAAVVIAALGPLAFAAVVQGFLTAGLAAGTGIGG